MKIGKSKSSINVSKPSRQNPEITITRTQLQELYGKEGELDHLTSKVQRSKPILNSIYEKVKNRQKRYEDTIITLTDRVVQNRRLATQYKELYEDGLRILERNRVVDQYKGQSNYREIKLGKQNEKEGTVGRLIEDLKKKYGAGKSTEKIPRKTIQKIKEAYLSGQKQRLTKEEIYKNYKARIDSDSSLVLNQKKQLKLTAKQYSQKLLRQIDRDLLQLTVHQKSGKAPFPNRAEGRTPDTQLKLRYLMIQRQKLQNI